MCRKKQNLIDNMKYIEGCSCNMKYFEVLNRKSMQLLQYKNIKIEIAMKNLFSCKALKELHELNGSRKRVTMVN